MWLQVLLLLLLLLLLLPLLCVSAASPVLQPSTVDSGTVASF